MDLPAWKNDFTWDTYACGRYIVVIHTRTTIQQI